MTHPETGRKSIYVNQLYTRRIKGLRKEDSDMLLQYLFKLVNIPELLGWCFARSLAVPGILVSGPDSPPVLAPC